MRDDAVRLLLLADTHLPRRAQRLPDEVWRAVSDADLVVHAGDWVDVALLEQISAHTPVLGVVGNNDGPDLRLRLPEVARAEVGGVRIVVVHETGPATGREARMDRLYPEDDVIVFGHSHIPWDTTSPGGRRLLNPGSPTDRRRQPAGTFMTAYAEAGALHEVTLHQVGAGQTTTR